MRMMELQKEKGVIHDCVDDPREICAERKDQRTRRREIQALKHSRLDYYGRKADEEPQRTLGLET